MLRLFADVILLVVICSIPYLVFRLRELGSKKPMYDSARYTTGMPEGGV